MTCLLSLLSVIDPRRLGHHEEIGIRPHAAFQRVLGVKANAHFHQPDNSRRFHSAPHLANVIYLCGTLLSPILVTKSEKIYDQLGVPSEMRNYDSAMKFGSLSGVKVVKGDQLFPRLDEAVEVQFIKDLMAAPKEKAAA
jgi:hypothetical protein